MNKFKKTKIPRFDEESFKIFTEGSNEGKKTPMSELDKDASPTKTFTITINDYDLGVLRKLKAIEERSQRKIASRLLSKALREELNKIESELE